MCERGATHLNPDATLTPARKYKRYDEAFQRSAVEPWLLSGKSARQIAQELGIPVRSLHNWKAPFTALPAGQVAGTLEAMPAEHRRRQRELPRMVQQRDMLKKTLGIISAPSANGLNG